MNLYQKILNVFKPVPTTSEYYRFNPLLEDRLIEHEKIKPFAYQDSKNYWTIGIGRNIDIRCGKGLSRQESLYLLNNDLIECLKSLQQFSWFNSQDKVRQDVLLELRFNMGLGGLLQFAQPNGMIELMSQGKYDEAADHLLASKWAMDVHTDRANDIAERLRTGRY